MTSPHPSKTSIGNHELHPETQMLNYGYDPELSEGAVKPPVFLTSTFVFKSAEDGRDFFDYVSGRKVPPEAAARDWSIRASTIPIARSSRIVLRSMNVRKAEPSFPRYGRDLDHSAGLRPSRRCNRAFPATLRRNGNPAFEDICEPRRCGRRFCRWRR